MTLHADTVWEIRTTGAQTNGGGYYNRVPGTSVDYSQQNTAQLSLSDIAIDGAGIGLSSATGGFTVAMQGNIIYLTGGGVIAGWYEIVSHTDTNNVTIDRSAGANKSGVTGNVGGAFQIGGSLDADFFATNQKVAGNKIWIKAGTYTLGEIITISANGTTALTITVEGYNVSRGDAPTGDNRPTISCGSSYDINLNGTYWRFLNLIFTGSATEVFDATGGGSPNFICYNCKFTNTSLTPGRKAVNVYNGYPSIISCEIVSINGTAIYTSSVFITLKNCYLHDSNIAVRATGTTRLLNCVIANCTTGSTPTGIVVWAFSGVHVFGCVIYNCTTGISGTTGYQNLFVNNIISGCTTGASWDSELKSNFWDFNCWYNTVDVSNVTKGPNDITADPKLKDPANDDFTLDTGSPCFDAGMQLGSIVGL